MQNRCVYNDVSATCDKRDIVTISLKNFINKFRKAVLNVSPINSRRTYFCLFSKGYQKRC